MDIDVLRVSGKDEWKRLDELTRQRTLSGTDIDELDRLYRSATTDLARVRTHSPDPDVIAELSRLLSAARGRLAGTGGLTGRVIATFFVVSLPLALYRIRWVILGVMTAFIALCAIQVHYLMTTPEAMNELGSPEMLRTYAKQSFVFYYHQDTHLEFGMSVWANNAWIAFQSIISGITGVYPLWVLWQNATSLGTSAAVVFEYGGVWHFFRFILPHGVPELTAVPGGVCDALVCRAGRREDWPWSGADRGGVGVHPDPGAASAPGRCQRGCGHRRGLLPAGRWVNGLRGLIPVPQGRGHGRAGAAAR